MEKNRVSRKTAVSVGDSILMALKEMRVSATHNTHRIFAAWDDASGAGPYTVKRFFRDGKLYITVSSSVIRNQLYFQKDALIEKINAILNGDPLFIKDDSHVGLVKELILK
ncbi:MAG: DUF721 domain-containing protein [Bacteroidales bacterium]|nr:DUF721 domain-containing protein [Bacteroidales bacterium]